MRTLTKNLHRFTASSTAQEYVVMHDFLTIRITQVIVF